MLLSINPERGMLDIVLVDSTNFTSSSAARRVCKTSGQKFLPDEMSAGNCGRRRALSGRASARRKGITNRCQVHEPLKSRYLPETSMLMELLSKGATVAMLSFVRGRVCLRWCRSHGLSDLRTATQARLVVLALLAISSLMPLPRSPWRRCRLDEPFGIGLLLLGCAGRAPVLRSSLNLPRAT